MQRKHIAALVVVILAVVAVGIGLASDGEHSSADARYNYVLELTDTIPDTIPFDASDGMQYLVVSWTVVNDRYSDGLTTNPLVWIWKATAHGVTYTGSLGSVIHPGYNLVTVERGGQASSVTLINVPDGLTLDDIRISVEYRVGSPALELDRSIEI